MSNCEICDSPLNRLNKPKICISCEVPICSECSPNGYLCLECDLTLDPKIRRKGWFINFGLRYIWFILSMLCFSIAVYYLSPWLTHDLELSTIISQNTITLAFLFVSITFLLLGIVWYRKSYKTLYKMDKSKMNKREVDEEEISEKELKPKRIMYILSLLANSGLIFLTLNYRLFGSEQPLIWTDILYGFGIILNIPLLYSQFRLENRGPKIGVKSLLSDLWWSIIFLAWLLAFAGPIYAMLVYGGVLQDQGHLLIPISDIHFWISVSLFSLLALTSLNRFVFYKDLKQNQEQHGGLIKEKLIIVLIRKLFGFTGGIILVLLWVIMIVISWLFIAGDIAMMLSFFSILLAIGIVIPIIGFTLIWCKNRMVNKMRWIHLRREVLLVGTLIFSIFLIPMVSTPLYTNPDLDTQFTEVFGTSWSQIQGDQRFAPLPKKEYSLYQNIIFGSIPSNTRFNTSYISDPPSFRLTGHTMENQTFTFDAYLPQSLSFGQEGDTEGTLLPVIIMLHGEYEDKGEWNANLTSQYLANLGFLVCDMNYGSIRTNNFGINATGYYISDMIRQIGYFTQYLAERRYEYRADMSSVYFSGRHLGGGLSLICGFGYNNTLAHLFSPEMNVKGIIPYYPTSDIGKSDTGFALSILTEGHTILNGSSDPSSPYYNEDWNNYNPIQLANRSIGLPPVFLITGTHDVLIPMRYQENFVQTMRNNGHTIIFGKYLLGSDGFDGNHNSPYGKSILYYYSRFLFLTL